MSILDRYIIRSFLKNYILSFLVLVGLYVALDMIFNFDELLETQQRAGASGLASIVGIVRSAADYYFYQSFLYFAQLSGIIPVVAAAFTLLRLSRFNELSAILAAGIPLLRVAAPIILCALLLNGLLILDQELVIPNMIPKLVRAHDEVSSEGKNAFPIRAMLDDQRNLLFAREFYPASNPPTMKSVAVLKRGQSTYGSLITARSATWDPARKLWKLEGGVSLNDLALLRPRRAELSQLQTSITPEEIQLYRRGEFVSLLSTKHVNELLDRKRTYGKADLVRAKHARLTQPLINMILLLLAMGCVLTREPQLLKTAATKCVILCGLCMASVFVAQNFATQPPAGGSLRDMWPALMAWMPVFIFLPGAVWLLDRVKT